MDKKTPPKGALTKNSVGAGPVTRAMVQARTRDLARIAGHAPPHVTQADYEQAKQELTGESDIDRQEAVLDSIPEEKRRDPGPGPTGRQVPESPSEDEDAEGRSETEQIVDAGVEAAGRDQMLQAARAAENRDRRQP